MNIPYQYGIETLSIYRDRDRDLRQRPRRRPDRDKNKEKDLETVKTVFAEKDGLGGEDLKSRTVGALHGGSHE
ncbi:MAG TPA: hypothetical protein VGX71_09335 [Pseudaminobacter sp.]|nr:hypothetical protein [Pseudaminobacter sp.]